MLDREKALEEMAIAGCREAEELLDYMNNLPPNRFERLLTKLDTAMEQAKRIDNEVTRNRQIDILRSVAIQPQPYYKPTKRTVRIFSSNDSVLMLKRELRQTLTDGFLSVDLTNAQLAIAAKIWKIPSVEDLLKQQTSMWIYFWEQVEKPSDLYAFKDVIKKAIYGTMFGLSKTSLKSGNKDFDGLDILLKPFNLTADNVLDLPIFKDILHARNLAYATIINDGGATDIFGRWIEINGDTEVNDVVAQVMQSYELYLMMPIVRAARITKEFTIVLWLHDGCYLDVKDNRRLDLWIDRLYTSVQENARKAGIYTQLEVK